MGRAAVISEPEAPDHADEADLVAAAQRDRRAFTPLYDRYADQVYRYCARRLGSREAAEDATGQVFTRALAGLPAFRGGSFAAWLFAIAHNAVANCHRDARPTASLEAAGAVADRDPSPEDRALAADDAAALAALLAVLPPDQRRVVELRLAGLTGAEIAASMDRSLAAVKMLQARALARMRAVHAAAEREGDRCGRR